MGPPIKLSCFNAMVPMTANEDVNFQLTSAPFSPAGPGKPGAPRGPCEKQFID